MVIRLFVLLSNNGCPFTLFIAQSHNTQAYLIHNIKLEACTEGFLPVKLEACIEGFLPAN